MDGLNGWRAPGRRSALTWLAGLGVTAVGATVASRQRITTIPTEDFTAHGFTRRTLQTPLGDMVLYEAGTGTPLLFLHGIGGGASSWTWSKIAPAFTDRFRVLVPDLIGWGLSDHPQRWVLFDDYVAQIDALLDDIAEPATIVAQSLVAGFAAAVANRTPDRVAFLLMVSPSGGKDFGEDAFGPVARRILTPLARRRPFNFAFYRLLFHQRGAISSWFASRGFYEPEAVSRELTDGWLYSSRQPDAAYSALPFLSGDLRYDIAPYLRDLRVPAAMVWGSDEMQIPPHIVARLTALNPHIARFTIERARSSFELELPARTIAFINHVLGNRQESPLTNADAFRQQ